MQAPFTRAVPQPPDPGQEITAPRLSSSPDAQQLQGVRGWFKRAVAALLMVTLTLSSTGQAIAQASNLITGSNGRPFTGYRADGTYVQAGRTDSSYHQQVQDNHLLQHQLENPALWTTSAVALSSSTDPTFVQMTIDQMMAAIAPSGAYAPGAAEPGGLYLGRLYLNINNPYLAGAGVLSAPPADAPESGATPPTGPLIDNYQHYALALAYAQSKAGGGATGDEPTGGWQSSVDGQYVGKSHEDSANSLKGKAFNDFIGKAVFQGAQDPLGGATAFFLIQGEQAKTHLSHLQQQQGNQLGSPILYTQQTLGLGQSPSGCGGRDSAPCPDLVQNFFNNVGSAPAPTEDERSTTLARFGLKDQDFVLGYIRGDGLAHDFEDGLGNLHFKNVGQNTEKLGEQLRQGAQQHWLGQQAAGAIDFGAFKEDRELFLQGVNPYGYVNQADHWLLNGLRNGSIQPGHPDYERARALAEQGFRSAYAAQVEYGFRPTFTKEGAAYQASKLELDTYSDSQFFEDGLYLYKNISQHDRELLDGLRHGLIKPGDALYNEARALAEARYRAAFQKALEPPKKSDPIKQLVGLVVAAVVAVYTAGAASAWAANLTGASLTASGAVATTITVGGVTSVSVAGVAATAIGSAVAGVASAVVGTGITTGSLSQAMKAGENALKGGVSGILVNTALAAAGLSGQGLTETLGVSEHVGNAIYNSVSGALTNTIANGGSFGDNLLNAAIDNAIVAASAHAANAIAAAELSPLGTEMAHAAVGCAVGVAKSGSGEGCAPGATGAVVAHLGAQWLDPATGFTLSDSEMGLYTGIAGGVAAALVGGSENVEGSFSLGQQSGQNAVENNYLTTRSLERALDALRSCTEGCDVIRNSLLHNEQQGGEQIAVARVQELCKANPQACASRVQDIGKALEDLQKPETVALLGQQNANALIARQLSDLGKAVEALQWGVANEPANRVIMQTAMAVGATALGGGVILSVGRALMAACSSGALTPACVSATTELAVGAVETAGGVPTVGMTAASTAGMASRLATAASSATDVAQVVREAQAVVGEARAIESARLLNNFYRDGAPPELIQKTYNAAAVSSTQNASASEVILGRYIAGSADSYDEVAKARGATYFSMSDWNNVSGQLGAEKMWEINKAFLNQQIAQGKAFVFTSNPASAPVGSYTNLEMTHILNSGYTIQPTVGGYFNAVKK